MRLGLISDTHGHLPFTRQGIQLLRAAGAQTVLHAGDIGSEAVLHELMEHFGLVGVPVYAVLGNVDLHEETLLRLPSYGGVQVRRYWPDLEFDGLRVAMAHGDDALLLRRISDDPAVEVVVTGHTHVAEDRRGQRPRVINPGAVYRTSVPSVALLDTATGALTFLPLPRVAPSLPENPWAGL
jgi:uncharacterized protein